MGKIKSFFSTLKDKLYSALKRYPVAVILLLLAACMAMVAVDINWNDKPYDDELFIRLAMSSIYSSVLSLVIKSAAERFEFKRLTEWLSYLLVPMSFFLVFYLLIPEFDSMVAVLRYFLTLMATAALFFFIPFIKSEKSASYFAQKVFLRLAVTMIYYGIITGGVEAIIFALENLLSINMPDEIYVQTAICLAGLFIPSFFFAGIPQKNSAEDSYPRLLKILLHYIVFPLLTAYTLVLYAYLIKILVEFKLPSGQLGNLVIYYSLISIAAIYFGHFTKDESRWTKIFNQIFPFALIIPTLMMIVSFWVRINQYGWTEPRYYAILCAIFVLRSISVVKLQKKVRIIPLVMSVLLLISVFGPLSSFNVSKWSQNRRFEGILTQAGMLQNGEIVPDADADDETKHEITQIVSYFESNHSTEDIKLIGEEFYSYDMENYFGFNSFYINKYPEEDYFRNYIYSDYEKTRVIELSGYNYYAEVYSPGDRLEFELNGNTAEITAHDNGENLLTISIGEETLYEAHMLDIIMPFFEESGGRDEPGQYVYEDENSNLKVKMIIKSADFRETEDYIYYNVILLIKLK